MPAPIVLQDQSGLAQGISSFGSSLGQALKVRGDNFREQKRFDAKQDLEQKKIQDEQTKNQKTLDITAQIASNYDSSKSIIDNIASFQGVVKEQGGDAKSFQPLFQTLLQNAIKSSEEDRGYQDLLQNLGLGNGSSNNAQDNQANNTDVPEGPRAPGINPPGTESVMDTESTIIDSVTTPDGSEMTEDKINALIASPKENHRRLGESLQKALHQEQQQQFTEDREVRKEHRDRIRKFSEPYDDTSKLQGNVNRMKNVEDLIENDSASFDDAFWRTTSAALLEDRGDFTVAELFKTPAQQKMYSLLRPFFATKEIGGSNPSTREVLLSLSALPSSLKGKEANRYIAKLLTGEAELALLKANTISEMGDKPQSWNQFQQNLNSKVEAFQEGKQKDLLDFQQMTVAKKLITDRAVTPGKVYMMAPDGSVHEVPKRDVKNAKASGGRLINGK